jgi:GTPase SAR1 family protein
VITKPKTMTEKTYKILLLGDSNTGKTSFIHRYIHDFLDPRYNPTKEYAEHQVPLSKEGSRNYNLIFCDGLVRFNRLCCPTFCENKMFNSDTLRPINGVLIFSDITNQETIDNALKWAQIVKQHTDYDVPIILIYNKSDTKQRYCRLPAKTCKDNFDNVMQSSSVENKIKVRSVVHELIRILDNRSL